MGLWCGDCANKLAGRATVVWRHVMGVDGNICDVMIIGFSGVGPS